MGKTMRTSAISIGFFLCLCTFTLSNEEEELRQINLGQLGPSLLSLLTAGLAGAGTAAAVGALAGGKGKHGSGLFGKHGIFGKHGKHGRSLSNVEEERQLSELSALLGLLNGGGGGSDSLAALFSLLNGADSSGLASLIPDGGKGKEGKAGKGKEGKAGKGGKEGKAGKGGKGKGGKNGEIAITDVVSEATGGLSDLLSGLTGRSLVESERHGKGKEGKGKGKEGKGKGKDSAGSSLLDTLSNNLLGQIIQAVLNLLTGAVSSLNPFRSALETKVNTPSLPNPLTDPLGFIQHPLFSAIIQAIVSGDPSALLKAQGDLAGTLITQFITNAISG